MKKVLAFFAGLWYHKSRSIGQAAKTSPSHGENKGSIPLSTAAEHFGVLLFFTRIESRSRMRSIRVRRVPRSEIKLAQCVLSR